MRPVAEAEARERAFVCTASHDLVTPLMAVTANCDVLEAEASDQAGLASWVANIRPAADEMATASPTCSCTWAATSQGDPRNGHYYPGSVWLRGTPVWGPEPSGPHRGTAMVATAPPEGLLASETEPPWALAASEAAWRPSP